MIICSCNVLSDTDVRGVLRTSAHPRTTAHVYGCLGCNVQCGRCIRSVRRIIEEASAAGHSVGSGMASAELL